MFLFVLFFWLTVYSGDINKISYIYTRHKKCKVSTTIITATSYLAYKHTQQKKWRTLTLANIKKLKWKHYQITTSYYKKKYKCSSQGKITNMNRRMDRQVDRRTDRQTDKSVKTEAPFILLSEVSGYVPCQSRYYQSNKLFIL